MIRNNGSSFHSSSAFLLFPFTNFSKLWIIKRRWDSLFSSFSFVLELDKEEKLKVTFFLFFFFFRKEVVSFPLARVETSSKPISGSENTWKKEWKRNSSRLVVVETTRVYLSLRNSKHISSISVRWFPSFRLVTWQKIHRTSFLIDAYPNLYHRRS